MKKIQKKSKAFQIFAIILSVLLVLITIVAGAELVVLNVLPTNLLVPVILILVLISAIGIVCVNFFNRKIVGKIFSTSPLSGVPTFPNKCVFIPAVFNI